MVLSIIYMANALLKSNSNLERITEFKIAADKICAIAAKKDLKITGYHSPDLPLYSALSDAKQEEALLLVKAYLKSMESAEAVGECLNAVDRSLWHALSTMGLVPPSDLLSRLKPSAVIELYDLQGLQIWRNFNFMRVCSYTLEEIYSIEWFNRYKRDQIHTEECIKNVTTLLSGESPEVFKPEMSLQIMEETCSQDRLKIRATYDLLSRLKNRDGELAAWLVATSADVIGHATAQEYPVLTLVTGIETPAPQPQI